MTIGNIIVELRTEQNISQKKLADSIGIGQSTIAQIELGRNEATAATIRKLAAFFDVSADYLLGLEDDFGARTTTTAAPMGESMTAEERELLRYFRGLSPYLKGMAMEAVKSWAKKNGDDEQKKA